jgi:hypothetical protein
MQIRCCTLRHYLFALFIGAGRRRIIERRPVNPLFKNAFSRDRRTTGVERPARKKGAEGCVEVQA